MPSQVIDLFCGVGGLTRGLLDAGLDVIAGFDIDGTCRYAYEHNNGVAFHQESVRDITGDDLAQLYAPDTLRILVGCAPCQPFSLMRSKLGDANLHDEKYNLLLEFGRLIEETQPAIISMENVPQLQKSAVLEEFLALLDRNGYH